MAIPLVQVRHKVTGRKTFLPETALRNFPDYAKTGSQKSRDQVPDGTAFPGAAEDGDELRRPQKNDSTDAWRLYAVRAPGGLTEEQAASMGRDEIIAHFDTQE